MSTTLDQALEQAKRLFTKLEKQPELQELTAAFGYDAQQLEEGAALLAAAEQRTFAQRAAQRAQQAAMEEFERAYHRAQALYAEHWAGAHHAFRNNRQARRTLGLGSYCKQRFLEWAAQASTFYTRLLNHPEYVAQVTAANTTMAALARGATTVETACTARTEQDRLAVVVYELGQQQITACKALRLWLNRFTTAAQGKDKHKPAVLRALGLEPSRRHGASRVAEVRSQKTEIRGQKSVESYQRSDAALSSDFRLTILQ